MGHSYEADALVLKQQAQIKLPVLQQLIKWLITAREIKIKINPVPERADKIVLYYKGR